ncbi:hypothetical protein ACN9ML_17515 [Dyadobacter endophyticus]
MQPIILLITTVSLDEHKVIDSQFAFDLLKAWRLGATKKYPQSIV